MTTRTQIFVHPGDSLEAEFSQASNASLLRLKYAGSDGSHEVEFFFYEGVNGSEGISALMADIKHGYQAYLQDHLNNLLDLRRARINQEDRKFIANEPRDLMDELQKSLGIVTKVGEKEE